MNIFANGLKPLITFASITLFLLVLDGGPSLPAFGADPYSGPLAISNVRIFKQSESGRGSHANELRRNDRYRLTFDIVNRSSGEGFHNTNSATFHHIRIRMSANPCYRAFTDQNFDTPWNPTGSKWDITPVNPNVRLLEGQNRSTQAYLYFVWNCNDENAMMMNPGLVPRVVALAEFDASLGGTGGAHLLPNQKVGTRYAIGGNCANNRQCVSNRCDAGDGTTKTNRCIPNDDGGRQGEYCTHHKHCGNGLRCKFSAPQTAERACLR